MRKRTVIIIRTTVFFVSALAALRALPFIVSASPFVAICSAVALRSVTLTALVGLPLLALGLFKGRWFCYHLCPAGFALSLCGKLNRRNKALFTRLPRAGYWFLALALGGALAGAPLFLWMDPLVLFNAFFGAFGSMPSSLTELLPAAGFGMVLLLSVVVPNIWCHRLCPLGELLGLAGALKKTGRTRLQASAEPAERKKQGSDGVSMARRLFLLVLGGVGGGSLLRLLQASRPSTAVRPPGSVADAVFAQLCARCGNCFRSCPESIIVPDIGQTGVSGLLSPVLDFDGGGYCSELCNECGRKCPTRAIRRLALDEKRATAIGIARVVKRNCLGWTRGVYCMICRGACPYQAMGSVVHGGVDCPVVKDDLCRGCGACRSVCPVRPAKAIEVVGIEQRVLRV